MGLPLLLRVLPLIALLNGASGETTAAIGTFADVNTECKACPHSLCPNILAYEQGESANVTCWTRGTRIIDTTLWLRSTSDCYVTEYDLNDNITDYTSALPYCGPGSEDEDLTLEDATLKYKTECRICPTISCDTVAYLKEDTDVELTCWTPDGQVIIDDPYWMKTTNNCYVAQKNLYSKPDITYLDPCGPIPYLEIEKHFNENGTSDVDKRDAAPEPGTFAPSYLINVTVGENYALCRSCAQETCRVERRYVFDQEVWLQCLVDTNGTWWSETTDFCYVKNSDFWQSPEGDYYRNPLCEYFEEPGAGPGDGDD
ncbi:hypothetical protein DPSP01_009871 [Paraphaeosphaeria sporulosa]|uniref:Uncharacterized protein n=1 Tax=Paraphaeosphaeria sporulosa TaxID=1460663 RepID=A0A177BW79_9PLEO|nr:uncharacterized protein CC84DRAFT_1234196 [Paraphaeosphaeria sporulosa]OAF98626.1 hypothetical protein CC84DRAFT_1234196 [Paraphaeosphaeria sporulosa]